MKTPPAAAPRLSSLEIRKSLEKGWVIGTVTKRTYEVKAGQCRVADAQLPLVEEPAMQENGLLDHDSDRVLQRRAVDVIIDGCARVPKPVPAFVVSVEVGALRREIAVFGERQLKLEASGSVALSSPEPIDAVPLRWEYAYGGVDHTLLGRLGDPLQMIATKLGEAIDPEQTMYAYPRNPHGRGYLLEASAESVKATPLPNLEDPSNLLRGDNIVRYDPLLWPRAPRPVSTTWLPYVHFPRGAQIGLPIASFADHLIAPSDFAEVAAGALRAEALLPDAPIMQRVNLGSAQGAALGMRLAELEPEAPVTLCNVHPDSVTWRFRLSSERPRMAYRVSGKDPVVLEPKIRCLQIKPDENRVCVVWVGEHRVDEPLTEAQRQGAEFGMRW